MRHSFVLIVVAVTLVIWKIDFIVANDTTTTASKKPKFELPTAHRYLKRGTMISNAEDIPAKLKGEERMSIPSVSNFEQLKNLFQKNLAEIMVKGMAKKSRISAFLAENPVIKKDIIIGSILLTLIIAVPLIVKSFYPA